MFAIAALQSRKSQSRIVVPSTAIMRLQDKDWVFRKEGQQRFRRIEISALGENSDGLQPVEGSLKAGEEIVANALEFSSTVAEQGNGK